MIIDIMTILMIIIIIISTTTTIIVIMIMVFQSHSVFLAFKSLSLLYHLIMKLTKDALHVCWRTDVKIGETDIQAVVALT